MKQQKTTLGDTTASREQETDTTIHTDSSKVHKIGGELLPVLNICSNVHMVELDFAINNIKTAIHSAVLNTPAYLSVIADHATSLPIFRWLLLARKRTMTQSSNHLKPVS